MRERLYFIRAVGTNLVKVGRSIDVAQRLRELQTGSPLALAIEDIYEPADGRTAAQLEAECHRRLHEDGCHERGEWFRMDHDDVLNITWELAAAGFIFHGIEGAA